MNNQVKLLLNGIRADVEAIANDCGADQRIQQWARDTYKAIGEVIDTPPVPTIKPGDTHDCPKCGEKNCFDTPLAESTALRFVWCSFCNQFSYKEDWR